VKIKSLFENSEDN